MLYNLEFQTLYPVLYFSHKIERAVKASCTSSLIIYYAEMGDRKHVTFCIKN